MTIDLSIVIVSYNTRDLLIACLASIFANKDLSLALECIVVDNFSTDGSVEAVHSIFPEVEVIANTQNVYFSAGNNQGFQKARGRYILALNPDTQVQGYTLRQLVQYLDEHPEVGAATTCMFFPDGKLQLNCTRHVSFSYLIFQYSIVGKLFPERTSHLNKWLWYSEWQRDTSRLVDVLPGSCIIATNNIWHRTTGFDASMKMYFSDDYFSRQVKRFGKQTAYMISDGVIHYEGQSSKQLSRRMVRIYFEDLLVYTKLVFGPVAQTILGCFIFPTLVIQYLKSR